MTEASMPDDYLRNRPQQRRSERRVEEILDIAEQIFVKVGYDSATTNAIASECAISVGTLYHYFPDKLSIAAGLSQRYLSAIGDVLPDEVVDEPGIRITDVVDRIFDLLVRFAEENPGFVVVLDDGPRSEGRIVASGLLRDILEDGVAGIVRSRVSGATPSETKLTARVTVDVSLMMLGRIAQEDRPRRRLALIREAKFVLVAYLGRKYPPPEDPSWSDPAFQPPPVRAGTPRGVPRA